MHKLLHNRSIYALSALALTMGFQPAWAQDRSVGVPAGTAAPAAPQEAAAPAAVMPLSAPQPIPIASAPPPAQGQPVFYLYEFSADWCPSCQVLKPNVERVAKAHRNQVKFIPVDIDDANNRKLVKRLGIEAIPTVVIYDPVAKAMRVLVGLQQGMLLERVLTESLQEKTARAVPQ